MANDREFIVQPLITEGRVVKLSDIDPTTSYAQIGVWQDNQSQNASAGNAYPSYVIPVSELLSPPDFKNYLIVDPVYGDDATAIPYDTHKPYKTVFAAMAAATGRDTLILNPGNHTVSTIINPTVKFHLLTDATLVNPFGSVFEINSASTLIVTGNGALVGGPFGPTVLLTGSIPSGVKAYIECDLIERIGNVSFDGVLFLESGAQADVKVREIRGSGPLTSAVVVTDGPFVPGASSKLNLEAQVVRFTWFAYSVGTNAKLYANVKETILEDTSPPAYLFFRGAYIFAVNNALNIDVRFNGNFYNNTGTDVVDLACGVVSAWNGASGKVVITGEQSELSLNQLISAQPAAAVCDLEIVVKTDLINTQGALGNPGYGCVMTSSGVIVDLRGKLATNIASTMPCIQYDNGTLILNGAVLISNGGAPSIAATLPITYKCYSGYANNAPVANATNLIVGTTLVVDSNVQ